MNQILVLPNRNILFEKIENWMLCCECKFIMIDACQASCGCRFCRHCISQYLKCPNCLEINITVNTDLSVEREILNLITKCFNCSERMQFHALLKHLASCKFYWCQCSNTRELFLNTIEDLKNSYSNEINNLKNTYSNEINNLKNAYSIEINNLKSQIYQLERTFSKVIRWTLDNICEKLTCNQMIEEKCYYLLSYKIALKINKNDKYLSVYFIICKGEYDHMLEWPFKLKLKLSLIGKKFLNYSTIFKCGKNLEVCGKPVNYNMATVFPKFIKIKEIMPSYVHDGSLILQLKII